MVNRMKERTARTSKPSRFVYTPRSAKSVHERANQTGAMFDSIFKQGFDVFKAKGGTNVVRILPPTWEEHKHYGFDIWVHAYVGTDNSTYLCLNKMKNKPCPMCEAAKEAKDAGETEDARKLQAKKKTVAWILERDGEVDTPQLWVMSWTIDRDVAVQCENPRTGKILQIDHPDQGYDVTFKRKGEGLKTEYYGFNVDRDPSPICDSEKEQEEVLEFITETPVPDTLKFYDADHLAKVIEGSAGSKDEEEEEERPRGRRGRRDEPEEEEEEAPRGRRGRRDEPEEEEEPAPRGRKGRRDVEEEPEEEEAPRSRRGRRDEPEEEEEPPPRRRGRAVEEEEEEPPPRRGRRDEPEEEEEPPPRRRGRAVEEAEEEEPPRRRGRRDEPEEEEEPPPRSRRGRDDPEEEEEEPPPRSRRGRATEEEPEEEETPRRGGRVRTGRR